MVIVSDLDDTSMATSIAITDQQRRKSSPSMLSEVQSPGRKESDFSTFPTPKTTTSRNANATFHQNRAAPTTPRTISKYTPGRESQGRHSCTTPSKTTPTEDTFRTPRKIVQKNNGSTDLRAQNRALAASIRVSSSPTRCSPSKRSSSFSSSSPTRKSFDIVDSDFRSEYSRPVRRRSRTSSGTSIIIEGLACTTVQCDNETGREVVLSEKEGGIRQGSTTIQSDGRAGFGLSTLQLVKMGLSKYTPLLKPNWLLSEAWKADGSSTTKLAGSSSERELSVRGHRRSKAAEGTTREGVSHAGLPMTTSPPSGTFINSPPLTAKEDGSKIILGSFGETISTASSFLGPAFTEDKPSERMNMFYNATVRRPVTARAMRGRTIYAYRSLPNASQSPSSRAFLSSKRSKRLATPSQIHLVPGRARGTIRDDDVLNLGPIDAASSTTTTDLGGLGIVCPPPPKQYGDDVLQSPMSSVVEAKGSTFTVSSLSLPDSPTFSSASSVPSIVVTPPATLNSRLLTDKEQRLQRGGVLLEYVDPIPKDAIVASPLMHDQEKAEPAFTNAASLLPPKVIAAKERPAPCQDIYETRIREDEKGLATFKIAVDALLSEYFIFRTVGRTWRLGGQMVSLLQSVMTPLKSKKNDNQEVTIGPLGRRFSPNHWGHELPLMTMPSLLAERWISEGSQAIKVPAKWGVEKLKQMMNVIMEHVVTGMVALITDDRAPYETPAALAHLCLAIREELPSLYNLHYKAAPTMSPKGKQPPDSPTTEWVLACYSTHSPDLQQSLIEPDQSEKPGGMDLDDAVWDSALRDLSPAATFLSILRRTIQNTFDKGETIRSKAMLLAVPPPRKGSRKRWQAANAEVNALKAVKEQDLSQVTRGLISEPEFRKRERKRAAIGCAKDIFAVLFFVRFVGELYNSRVLQVSVIRQWLQRFFFNTVFPGVPSTYELEAGCALLITVGATLDREAGTLHTFTQKRNGQELSSQVLVEEFKPKKNCQDTMLSSMEDSITTTKSTTNLWDRTDDAPANHWILVSPKAVREMHASCSPHALLIQEIREEGGKEEYLSDQMVANRTITATMARLREILAIREVDSEGRVWCREVLGLRNRAWQQGGMENGSGPCQKIISLRKFHRDVWEQ